MKIGIHMLTLNDGPYVWWALNSTYSIADYIAVIEGAITHDEYGNKFDHVPASSRGLSLDDTGDEVRRFMEVKDREGKIHYEQVGFVHSWEDLRNAAHQSLPKRTDIELIQDGDCLYHPENVLKAVSILEAFPEIYEIAPHCWSFIWDFRHVMRCRKKWKEYWRWCFFRYNSSMVFEKERTIRFDDGSSTERRKINWSDFLNLSREDRRNKRFVIYDPFFQVFHFGNVQEKERMEVQLMRKFFSPQVMKRNHLVLPDRKRETLLAWLSMYHKYYTKVPDDEFESFEEFTGKYPVGLEKHPYFGRDESWFRHNGEYDLNSPFYEKKWWD
jgi:hypothetical protein